MGNFNHVAQLMKEGKLVGPNYMTWKRKLNLVLIVEDVGWVIETLMPLLPAGHTSE